MCSFICISTQWQLSFSSFVLIFVVFAVEYMRAVNDFVERTAEYNYIHKKAKNRHLELGECNRLWCN